MEDRAKKIAELLDHGLSGAEVARRLGVSHSTVSRTAARMGRSLGRARGSDIPWAEVRSFYEAGHSIAESLRRFRLSRGAWDRAVSRGDIVPQARTTADPSATRKEVRRLLDEGQTQSAIAESLTLSKSCVAHRVRELGIAPDSRFSRRYDWDAIQRDHDAGLSARECRDKYGFAAATWSKAVSTGRIVPRARALPLEEYLVRGRSATSRRHLKARLIQAGLKEDRCEQCGIDSWLDLPLSVHLHHRNGDGLDNRLENLQLLCPNCHSQTDTYGGRNGHRRPTPDL